MNFLELSLLISKLISLPFWKEECACLNVKIQSFLLSMLVSLFHRALTALELRKKLLGKRFSPDSVEAVINKFQRRYVVNYIKTVELLFISQF